MSHKNAHILSIIFILFTLSLAATASAQSTVTPQPSQVDLGDVKGAVVTLYYFDQATGGKGAMVPLPDGQNPQEVQWDYTKAAPGTYTFYKVPQGTYYVEAVHGNHTWFALVTIDQGTSTANVAIPPYNDSGFLATPSPEATASPSPSVSISPTETPASTTGATPSPGMTTLCALTGLTLVALYVVVKRE
ncbi:MAG TPA: hypothetical protein VGJ92_02370 [Methanocella sp.]|jgi:hypothetical protein